MSVLSAYRSTQTGLWVNSAKQPGIMAQIKAVATANIVISAVGSETGVFGGSFLNKATPSVAKSPMWPGFQNCPDGASPISILVRIIPRWDGQPSASIDLLAMQASNPNRGGLLDLILLSSGALRFTYIDADGQTGASSITTTATFTSFVSGQAIDIMFSWDGTTNTNAAQFSVNGVLLDSKTASSPMFAISQLVRTGIVMGNNANAAIMNADINEFVIFNSAENPVYATRTGFYPVAAFDASVNTDPGISNVAEGTDYEIAGVPLVGTKTSASTDPGAGNVRQGVAYEIDGSPFVGSYDPWTVNGAEGLGAVAAAVDGLKTYLEGIEGLTVLTEWPYGNQKLAFPSVTLFAQKQTRMPLMQGEIVSQTEPAEDGTITVNYITAEYDFQIQLDLWASDKLQRSTFTNAIIDAINASEADATGNNNPDGLRLTLASYFGVIASYNIDTHEHRDDEQAAQRQERRERFTLLVNLREVRQRTMYPMTTIQQNIGATSANEELTDDLTDTEEFDV